MTDRVERGVARRRQLRVRSLQFALALLGVAAPAAGQVTCGGTVGPGGTVTMTSDILNCASDPALRVVGKVVLNMAGHRLTCATGAAFAVGISIEGKDATVRNGVVDSCPFGVGVFGKGRHTVRNMAVSRGVVGIVVSNDRNRLSGNGARRASAAGFSISGNDNEIEDDAAVDSPTGFLIIGLRNSFARNVAMGNLVGFDGSGSAETVFSNNIADANDVGFRVGGGSSGVKLKKNVATGSDRGFDIGGSNHVVSSNTAVNSALSGFRVTAGAGGHLFTDNVAIGTRDFDSSRGFLIAAANDNELAGNRAFNNFLEGIAVSSQSNLIRDSVALGNSPDLNDFNPDCADNVWINNLGDKVQSCME